MTLPYRIQNAAGNKLDADKEMANFDYLEAIARRNFLTNGGLETWNVASSFTNPSSGTTILDGWSLEKGGTSGATADITRESSTKDSGSYSVKVNITSSGSSNSYLRLAQSRLTYAQFANLFVIAGVKIKVGTASKVRVSLTDGVTTVNSAYHTGGGSWEKLTAELAVSGTPSALTVKVEITSDFTDAVYIDSAFLYVIPSQATTAAKDALEFNPTDDAPATDVSAVMGYRPPNLIYVSATQFDVENNTTTANQTEILFPDGEVRRVTEDTSSTHKYRRADITATAEFTSGTEDSGVRSGISEAANTTYAVYAVKSLIDSSKFITALDTTHPTQANAATLNSRYGANGWVFLGYRRNGNGTSGHSDFLDTVQIGPWMLFKNTLASADTAVNAVAATGLILANTASAASVTWSYSAGSGAAQVPETVKLLQWLTLRTAHASYDIVTDSGAARTYERRVNSNNNGDIITTIMPATEGIKLTTAAGASEAFDAICIGWYDSVLAAGANPQI